jgi:hypothetical protein
VRSYGLKALEILGGPSPMRDLGEDFGHGMTEAEVRYLMKTNGLKLLPMWCGAEASLAFVFTGTD